MGRKNHGKHQTKTKPNHNNAQFEELNNLVDMLLRISTVPAAQSVSKALLLQKEINVIIEKVQTLEAADAKATVDLRQQSDTIERFVTWVRDNGAKFEGCTITEFPGYDLGIKADIDIPKDSLVIAVPRTIMLTIEAASKSALSSLIERDQILKNMPNVVLAMFLLVEKFKGDSFWKPYIDILPKTYTTVLYFDERELEELQGSPTLDSVLKLIKSIVRQYAYFHRLINTSDEPVCNILKNRFTYEEYRWAVSTVMTRQNTIPSRDGSQIINALIPLWDICNHTNGTISTDYNPQLDRSECLALRDFKAGEQLFIFYGARSNSDLFVHNGFVYEDNVHDGYWLRLGISKSDPLQNKKTELLTKLSLPTNGDFWIRKGPQPIDGKLIAFLRIFNMNEGQLQSWLESDRSEVLQQIEIAPDTALEKKSWTFLQTRLKLLLAAYKTTLEEDLKLLSDSQKITRNKTLAIKMRVTEKKILRDTVDYIEQRIVQL